MGVFRRSRVGLYQGVDMGAGMLFDDYVSFILHYSLFIVAVHI